MKNQLINDDEKVLRCGQFLILYHYLSTTKPVLIKDLIGVALILGLFKGATKLGISLNVTTAVLVAGFLAKKTITHFFAGYNESQQSSEADPNPNQQRPHSISYGN